MYTTLCTLPCINQFIHYSVYTTVYKLPCIHLTNLCTPPQCQTIVSLLEIISQCPEHLPVRCMYVVHLSDILSPPLMNAHPVPAGISVAIYCVPETAEICDLLFRCHNCLVCQVPVAYFLRWLNVVFSILNDVAFDQRSCLVFTALCHVVIAIFNVLFVKCTLHL